jgi:hypothetical protein
MVIFTVLLLVIFIVSMLGLFLWFTYLIAGDIILQQLKIIKSRRK